MRTHPVVDLLEAQQMKLIILIALHYVVVMCTVHLTLWLLVANQHMTHM